MAVERRVAELEGCSTNQVHRLQVEVVLWDEIANQKVLDRLGD